MLRDAEEAGRRWVPRAVAVVRALAAVAALALLGPFGSNPGGLRIDRAPAAFGAGPIVHAVIEHPADSVVIASKPTRSAP